MPRTLFTKFHSYSYSCLLTLKAGTLLWIESRSQYALSRKGEGMKIQDKKEYWLIAPKGSQPLRVVVHRIKGNTDQSSSG